MTEEIKILFTKYLSGDITPEESTAIESWINQSEENRNLFYDIKSVWLLSGVESKDSKPAYKKVWSRIENRVHEYEKEFDNPLTIAFEPVYNLKRILAIAAMFILALCIGGLSMYIINLNGLFIKPTANNIYQPANDTLEIVARKGSKSEIILPDGSKVWLNSNSKIKYYTGFGNGNREVYLTGEAFFDIEQTEDKRLFYVHTTDIKIKVLGTTFNVKSYPEEGTIETTLEKGRIEIEKTVNNKDVTLLSLKPNQQATFIKKEGKIYIEKIKDEIEKSNTPIEQIKRKEQIILDEKVETSLYTSWKDGYLPFVSESFENMVVQFERWFDVTIKIENEDLKKMEFTATFNKHTIEQALDALKLAYPFEYEYNLKQNIITIK